MNVSLRPFGAHAILIDWPATIDKDMHQELLDVHAALQASFSDVLVETVISYHTIVLYLKETTPLLPCLQQLEAFMEANVPKTETHKRVVSIPVCYKDCFALDIDLVAQSNGLTAKEVISMHTAKVYPVYFLGFLPGFPYLGGLDERLHTPRLESPRLHIAAGSVGIGGSQTGIYPSLSPGGWNIIGKTPVSLFNVTKSPPNLLMAGDRVCFESISKAEFDKIQLEITAGTFRLKTASL